MRAMVSWITIVLPLFASPLFAYLYTKTYRVGTLKVPRRFLDGSVRSLSIENDIVIIEDKNGGYIGTVYIDLGREFHDVKERTPESLFARATILGRLLSSVDSELELRTVKLSLDSAELARKIEHELSSLRTLLETQPDDERLRERERILQRVYMKIRNGESVSGFRTYIVLRRKGRDREEVKNKLRMEAEELSRAISISLGLKPQVLRRSDLRRIVEARMFLAPQLEPALGTVNEAVSSTPMPPYESGTLDPRGVFIGYRRGTKIPFLYNIKEYGTRHVLVVGPTGKGKTTLLATIANRLYSRNQVDMLMIDPKGDLGIMLARGIPRLRFSTSMLIGGRIKDLLIKSLRELGLIGGIGGDEKTLSNTRTLGDIEEALGIRLVYADPSSGIIDLSELNRLRTAVVSLDNLTDDGRFVATLLLLGAFMHALYLENPYSSLRKLLIVDEAWRSSEASIYYTRRLVKEARGFGVGLLFSTQSISDIPKEVTHNFGTAMVFGSSDSRYIRDIQDITGFPEQELTEILPTLGVGQVLVKIPDSRIPCIVDIDPEIAK